MGRQWERQLLLPFSFYIDAKVLLFFELAKFNLECEPHGQKCGTSGTGETGGTSGTGDTGGTSGTGETGGKIIRLSFAYPSLIVRLLFTLLILFSLYCFLRFFNFYIF